MAGDDHNGDMGNKRHWDGRQSGDGAKRFRMSSGGDRPHLRFLISSSTAGAIIGKGGSKITNLRKQYNASIQIPDSRGEERVVITYASSIDDLAALCGEIAAAAFSEDPGDGQQEVRLLVHQSQAGGIIGTKGSTIKEMREKTGATIKIFQDCCPNSTDRICQIRGDNPVITHCSKLILEFLETAPPKGPVHPYNPSMRASNDYGGFMQSGFQPNNFMGWNYENQNQKQRPFGRDRGRRDHQPQRNDFGGSSNYGRRFGGNQRGYNDNHSRPFGGNMRSGQGSNNQEKSTAKVTIPSSLAGCIIGRGGQRISGIRQECGAQITIAEPEPGSDERIITISGSEEQIQNAQFLLQRSVKMYSDKY